MHTDISSSDRSMAKEVADTYGGLCGIGYMLYKFTKWHYKYNRLKCLLLNFGDPDNQLSLKMHIRVAILDRSEEYTGRP